MALPHFYTQDQVLARLDPECLISGFALDISNHDLHHAQVLRLREGEHIAVVDAAYDYFECEVCNLSKDGLAVKVTSKLPTRPIPKIVLVQGLAKGDKMDDICRHTTELGICAFVPFASERSIVKLDPKKTASRVKRWAEIAKSAAAQSAQRFVPNVSVPVKLTELVQLCSGAAQVLLCWEECDLSADIHTAAARASVAEVDASTSNILTEQSEKQKIFADALVVIIGPEGGLAPSEVNALLQLEQTRLVSLGPSILRTETAGIAALALIHHGLKQQQAWS